MFELDKGIALNLELSADGFHRVCQHAAFKKRATASQTRQSTYFDTKDFRLRDNGLSIRILRAGDHWLQIVRLDAAGRGGVVNPIETEGTVAAPKPNISAIPDKMIRKHVRRARGKAPLLLLFDYVAQRTTHRLKLDGGTEIDIELEKGVVRGLKGTREHCSVQLKLSCGHPRALLTLSEGLLAQDVFEIAPFSPADWGYELAGLTPRFIVPRKAYTPVLPPKYSASEALRQIADEVTGQILHNWAAVLQSDDPEGTHQMRIGLRRSRCALQAARIVVDNDVLREILRLTRDLARQLGKLRDADVIVADIDDPAAAMRNDNPDVALLKTALTHNQVDRRADVRSLLRNNDWSSLKLRLAVLPASIEFVAREKNSSVAESTAIAMAQKALRSLWRKVAKSGRKLAQLSIAERHDLRKDIKNLRYTIELFATLFRAKDVDRFVRKLQRLQDTFGYLNDVALAEKLTLTTQCDTSKIPDV